MSALRTYLSTFILDSVSLDICMIFLVVLLFTVLLKVFCVGLFR